MILFFLACAAQADETYVEEEPAQILELIADPTVSNSGDPAAEQLMRDMMAMELFLMDKKNYKLYCEKIKWEQPSIKIYKKELVSQLPAECQAKIPPPPEEEG